MKKTLSLFTILFFGLACTSMALGGDPKTDPENDKSPTIMVTPSINSYTYNTAIGVRGIGTSGLTIKHFTSSDQAIEGIIGFGHDAFSITGLWEKYFNAYDVAGLHWYYGVGGHIATQSDWVYIEGYRSYRRSDGDFGIGVDGIFGIEYKIKEAPIALSIDLKPFLEVTTNGDAYLAVDPGLGVKFTF